MVWLARQGQGRVLPTTTWLLPLVMLIRKFLWPYPVPDLQCNILYTSIHPKKWDFLDQKMGECGRYLMILITRANHHVDA